MLEIALLAPLTIKLDGKPLKLPSRRTEALVVYLLRNPHPHAREVLANLLWDDLPQNKALGNLRVLLANLRKALEPYVTITRQSAAWNGASNYRVDLTTLEELLTLSRIEIERDGALTKATAASLGMALQGYRGDLLPGFHLREGQGFEEWLATEREWLWTKAVEALDDLATEYLQWGDYRAGVEQAQRLVDLDPLREEGHQLLMQLWGADGQISAALAQYEQCVQLLDQELGVPPHPFTTELHARMQRGDWQLPHPRTESGTAAEATMIRPLPHNLPRRMSPIWGRATELAQLAIYLGDPTVPLITILGPGGIGKTLLAIEAARALITVPRLPAGANEERIYFQDGIYLVALASLRDAAAIAPAIAAVIGCRFQPNGGDESTQLLHYLRGRALLLLLDNAEHLLDETELFGAILAAAPQVQLLITSRHKLNQSGETVLLLTGLDYPQAPITHEPEDTEAVGDRLLHYSAVRLFVEHVRRPRQSQPGRRRPASGWPDLSAGPGLPLAILLAAAWVELLSPAEIATEIEQNVAFLRLAVNNQEADPGKTYKKLSCPPVSTRCTPSLNILGNY
ncbi:MAG: BTAD domain-containing putative transcriptional regulator [Caldilineaceae bacterium]